MSEIFSDQNESWGGEGREADMRNDKNVVRLRTAVQATAYRKSNNTSK